MTPEQKSQIEKEATEYANSIITNPHLRTGSVTYSCIKQAYIAKSNRDAAELSALREELEKVEAENGQLRIDASNHAHDADTVRRERDKAESDLSATRAEVEELKRRNNNQRDTIHGFQKGLSDALGMSFGDIHEVAFVSDAVRGIDKLKADIEKLRKWIPVSERLPIIGGEDTLVLAGGYKDIAKFSLAHRDWVKSVMSTDGRFIDIVLHDVTHWQPLPPNPEH